jgi:hypothetical protein
MHSAKRGLCCSNVTRGLCLVLGGFVVVVCGGCCTVEERTVVSVCLVVPTGCQARIWLRVKL